MEKTHRRVVDPSENGTPNTRSELPMPLESFYRRVEIPIESQVGIEPCQTVLLNQFIGRNEKLVEDNRSFSSN